MIKSNYIQFFQYNVDINTRINQNSTTSTFLFVWSLDEYCNQQFDIIQSKLLHIQQFIKQKNTLMLIYVITILNIALINFIMIVNI